LPQPLWEAKLRVAGLDGGNNLEIPDGTQTGETLEFAAREIKHLMDMVKEMNM